MRRTTLPLCQTTVAWSACLSVSVCWSKTARPMEVPFGMLTRVCTRNHVFNRGGNWRHLANRIERSVLVGDAVCRYKYWKNIWGGAGSSSFVRQQRLSEITIEPNTSTSSRTTVSNCPVLIIFFWGGGAGQDLGACAPPGPT